MKKYYSVALAGVAALSMLTACNGSTKSGDRVEASEQAEVSVASVGGVLPVDTATSVLNWKGFKPGGEHFGKLPISEGQVTVENGKLLAGSVVFQMNGIVVEDLEGEAAAGLKGHLENADFFEVEKYPTARFELTGIGAEGLDLATLTQLEGNLTLKSETKNVVIPIESVQQLEGKTIIKSKSFRIDRTDWKVEFGSKNIFKNLGDNFIDDEIELGFTLVF